MALFGRGTPPRTDDLRKGVPREASPRQFMAVAEELRRANRMRECIETLERGVKENPGYVAAHVALGRAFQQAELIPRAIAAYQDALKIDRENLVAVRQLADCFLRQGEKLEALKKLKLFRGLKPGEKGVDELIAQIESDLQAARREPAAERRESTGAFARPGAPSATRTGAIPPLPPRTAAAPPAPAFVRPAAPAPPSATPPPAPSGPASAPAAVPAFDFDSLLATPAEPTVPAFESFLEPEKPRVSEVPPKPAADLHPEPVIPAFTLPVPSTPPSPTAASAAPAVAAARTPEEAFRPESPEPETRLPEPERREGAARPEEVEELFAPPPPERPAGTGAPTPAPPPFPWEEEALAAPLLTSEPFEEEAASAIPEAPAPTPEAEERVTLPGLFVPPEATPPSPIAAVREPEEEAAPPAAPQPAAPPERGVTETLAELYRSQGHLAEAAEAYEVLARTTTDARSAAAFRTRAEDLAAQERATPAGRLRAFARHLPVPPETTIEEMGSVLDGLRTRAGGVRAAVLTDLEGLPLVSSGEASGPAAEALVAELTAFWKGVQRTQDEVGAGELRAVSLKGEAGGVLVTAVSPDYSLILHLEREVPLGRIRYEAARAAGLLRPALG